MPSFNRRHFGKLIAGAAAALPLTAAATRTAAATDEKAGTAAAVTPLTPEQMEEYRKALPDQAKELDKLHHFDLGYGYEPDFIFRAVGPAHRPAAGRTRARKATSTKVKTKVKNG